MPPVVMTTSAGRSSAAAAAGTGSRVLEGGEPFGVAVADFHFLGADSAEHLHHGGQLGSEGVADLPGRRQPGCHHLGAGEHEPDHGLAEHLQGVVSGQGGEGQVGRIQDRAAP